MFIRTLHYFFLAMHPGKWVILWNPQLISSGGKCYGLVSPIRTSLPFHFCPTNNSQWRLRVLPRRPLAVANVESTTDRRSDNTEIPSVRVVLIWFLQRQLPLHANTKQTVKEWSGAPDARNRALRQLMWVPTSLLYCSRFLLIVLAGKVSPCLDAGWLN